jgi:serine/threonine protein kinase
MQKNKIIHRDIKPQNILIHNCKIKIADFGFSKVRILRQVVDDLNVATKQTLLGTPYYLPIEILTGEKYSSKCDVFSVGIVLYELVTQNK